MDTQTDIHTDIEAEIQPGRRLKPSIFMCRTDVWGGQECNPDCCACSELHGASQLLRCHHSEPLSNANPAMHCLAATLANICDASARPAHWQHHHDMTPCCPPESVKLTVKVMCAQQDAVSCVIAGRIQSARLPVY